MRPSIAALVPLLRTHPSIAVVMPLLRDAVLYVHCSCGASCLLHTRTQHQHTNKTSSHIMSCAAGELCQLPNIELIAPNGRDCGHECRGGCGGKLHGTCGEVEDLDGDNDNHRICHKCISNRSLSNPAKRKQGQDFVLPRASKKAAGAAGAKKPRKRLSLGEKLEVLALLDEKVSYAEIARRHGCGTTAIGTVKSQRKTLKAVEFWVELEEQEEVAKALAADTKAVLIEKMNEKFTEDSDSDEEKELNNTGEVESAESGRLMAPPPYSDLSGFLAH